MSEKYTFISVCYLDVLYRTSVVIRALKGSSMVTTLVKCTQAIQENNGQAGDINKSAASKWNGFLDEIFPSDNSEADKLKQMLFYYPITVHIPLNHYKLLIYMFSHSGKLINSSPETIVQYMDLIHIIPESLRDNSFNGRFFIKQLKTFLKGNKDYFSKDEIKEISAMALDKKVFVLEIEGGK